MQHILQVNIEVLFYGHYYVIMDECHYECHVITCNYASPETRQCLFTNANHYTNHGSHN